MDLRKKRHIAIDRAINELRSGRPIIINNKSENWIFYGIEHINDKFLSQITSKKSKSLNAFLTNKKMLDLSLDKISYNDQTRIPIQISDIKWLKSIHTRKINRSDIIKFKKIKLLKTPLFLNDMIDLAKNAKTIPCLIGCLINKKSINHSIMVFKSTEIKMQNKLISESTKMVSESTIPIKQDYNAKIKVFKSFIGGLEHVVLCLGKPNNNKTVNLRIQSACLTGEVFHSMKCDCGEQLNQSIEYLSKNGGGYIIHLEQEGRGIGLKNKIRAYNLQHKGMDTIDADRTMGFVGEERDFSIAVKILKDLGVKKVNIITNNQDKIKALKNSKISIAKKIATYTEVNKFNVNYFASRLIKMNYNIKLK
ncbi:MAG: GTP cyclohydrolase-2 [Alphaproteobacteria bacterium MarineAlpha5_Bin11]|nr:hypothetical protein [Pelagibacteraceae bacterium]PPR44483.1 MAG: GTP cyclohydrolase-2 [Alphaproteobacteria bacterium MarineAlpha5_Bin11]PPR51173.1 MAG: GTP cyclohydrolase-2 [Alphaproteobacteria bacterium MarineAlpha5_Bin10]|tara:strand:- start:2952 stop:4046 length:1095 start_codon:yes stop_codon:yes gene_type:complete